MSSAGTVQDSRVGLPKWTETQNHDLALADYMGWYVFFAYFFTPGKEFPKVTRRPSLKRLLAHVDCCNSKGGSQTSGISTDLILLQLKHLGLDPRPTESDSLGMHRNLHFDELFSLTHAKVWEVLV